MLSEWSAKVFYKMPQGSTQFAETRVTAGSYQQAVDAVKGMFPGYTSQPVVTKIRDIPGT
jgi:hypothetical protein